MHNDSSKFSGCLVFLSFFLLIVGSCIFIPLKLSTLANVEITIRGKERTGGEDGKYLVFTETEVFENTDEFFKGKFNSSDVYNQFDIGKTYKCEVIGWRIPLLSWYRNIIKCS